jgi:hypothetical protein
VTTIAATTVVCCPFVTTRFRDTGPTLTFLLETTTCFFCSAVRTGGWVVVDDGNSAVLTMVVVVDVLLVEVVVLVEDELVEVALISANVVLGIDVMLVVGVVAGTLLVVESGT